MHLHPIDWTIIVVYLIGCIIAGVWMKRYVRGVEDFAVAGREMDMNMGIASLAATELGIVTVMYTAEMGFTSGFAGAMPGILTAIAMFVVGMTGFVINPLRESGVITIPQLFEKRFGVRVRWLAGLVIILGGVLNMGVFLRVGGEFLVGVTGLDGRAQVTAAQTAGDQAAGDQAAGDQAGETQAGEVAAEQQEDATPAVASEVKSDETPAASAPAFGFSFNGPWGKITFGPLELTMIVLLTIVLLYTVLGGMVSVLVTDYIQFLVMSFGIVITSVLVILHFGWDGICTGLWEGYQNTAGNGTTESVATTLADGSAGNTIVMKNPFNPFGEGGIGGWWIFWQSLHALAVVTTWQTTIARVLAAKDSNTAKRIYRRTAFFWVGRFALPGLWGAAAFVFFYLSMGGLPEGIKPIEAMPHFLSQVLPVGVIGILLAAMLAAEMSTDSGYLLTWATVIYNDLIMPVMRTPLSPKGRLFLVRCLVVVIGLFLVFYGLVYQVPGNTWDYLSITGNIYLASLLALLTGALYWRGANSWGGYAAIVLGAAGPIAFLIVNIIKESEAWMQWFASTLSPGAYNALEWGFDAVSKPEVAGIGAYVLAFGGMIVGSLIGNALGLGISGEVGHYDTDDM